MAHSYQNLAVSGQIAVGSTSLAKALSQKLNWSLRDGSQIFRDVSMQFGFDLEKNPQKYGDDIDRKVDQETALILQSKPQTVVTSKLAAFLSRDVPHTYRVLVTAPLSIRAQRYSHDRGHTPSEAQRLIELREREDHLKWTHLYGDHDFFDPRFFNLVLDSSQLSVAEEVNAVIKNLSL